MNPPDLDGCRVQLGAGEFVLRAVDPTGDLVALHAWMNDPEIARFWQMAWPADRIEHYLQRQSEHLHSLPCIGLLDGVAMSYWELYRADLDPLADHYRARPRDRGVHLLLGPASCRGRGLGTAMLRAVSDWQLSTDPTTTRVVAEPDVRNVRSIRAFERAGFRRSTDLDLPDKRAALMIRDRST